MGGGTIPGPLMPEKYLFSPFSVFAHAVTVQRVGIRGRGLGRARGHRGRFGGGGGGRMIGERKGVEDEGARERMGERGRRM